MVFDDLHFLVQPAGRRLRCALFTWPEIPGRGHWIYERPFGERVRAGLVPGAGRRVSRSATGARTATSTAGGSTASARSAGSPRRGVTGVSQTGGPETVLAGEARLAFGLVGFVTDHANGVEGRGDASRDAGTAVRRERGIFQRALRGALPLIAADPGSRRGFVFSL